MSKNKNRLFISIAIVLTTVFLIIVYNYRNDSYEKNPNKMVKRAESFWNKGEKNKAINQLWIYLESNGIKDVSAWDKLISYYEQMGDTDEIVSVKQRMLKNCNSDASEENQLLFNINNRTAYIENDFSEYTVNVTAELCDTDEIELSSVSDNLFDNNPVEGKVDKHSEDLITYEGNYLTTNWFPIDEEKKYISLSGGFNVSMWQFKNANGEIINALSDGKIFHLADSNRMDNHFYSTISIPKEACYARVTFMNKDTIGETSGADLPTYITYGNRATWQESNKKTVITLPALKKGESLTYNSNDKVWKKITNSGEEVINIEGDINLSKGNTISILGTLPCEIKVNYSVNDNASINTNGEYGIRYLRDSADPYCERVGDAKGLSNGYYAENEWIGEKEVNDFDNIAPWSEMKLCTIDANGNVSYDIDKEDNSKDVMVEIPKFYYKREIIDNYEYIWISATYREGYQVEPAFVTTEGEKDHIYIGAYLSSLDDNNNIASTRDSYPLINVSLNKVNELMNSRGQNYHELDYVTLSMIQRLFLVETACKNSQEIAYGATSLSIGRLVAQTTFSEPVNYIDINDDILLVGDAVYIFDAPSEDEYYDYLLQYDPYNKASNRYVTDVVKYQNGGSRVYFSGDPVTVTESKTIITHIARINGETDEMEYHTGRMDSYDTGICSFKYRNIENLWGSVCILLDNTYVRGNAISIYFPNGLSDRLSYELPTMAGSASELVSPAECSVLSLGYDARYPGIMLPDRIAGGASANSGFGDAVFYIPSNESYVLTYGLTWDLKQYAGLFGYRANFSADTARIESGSRMIYR